MSNSKIVCVVAILVIVLNCVCAENVGPLSYPNHAFKAASQFERVMTYPSQPRRNLVNRRQIQTPIMQIQADSFRPRIQARNPLRSNQPLAPSGAHVLRHMQNSIPPISQRPVSYLYETNAAKFSSYSQPKVAVLQEVDKKPFFRQDSPLPPKLNYPSEQSVSSSFNKNITIKDKNEQYAIPQLQQFNQQPQYGSLQYQALSNQERPHYYQSLLQHKKTFNKPPKQIFQYQSQNSYFVNEDTTEHNLINQPTREANKENPSQVKTFETSIEQYVTKNSEDYLKFMNSNEYFLPKYEPNYKLIDQENDRLLDQHILQLKQSQGLGHTQLRKEANNPSTDIKESPKQNQHIQKTNFFYQNPVHTSQNIGDARGSYQTGKNIFVVKSDGNKAIKHILSNGQPQQTSSVIPSYARIESRNKNIPEPLRFEFTEQDALFPTAYTNLPETHHNYFYQAVASTAPPKPNTYNSISMTNNLKANEEVEDDSEDTEDTHELTLPPALVTVPNPSIEQKQSEEYCEKMCATVYDENDKIVCGSDGYMYNGEVQLNCYTSCLHKDVSIKSKGSCTPL